MTIDRETVIRLVKEVWDEPSADWQDFEFEFLDRFAALVLEHGRNQLEIDSSTEKSDNVHVLQVVTTHDIPADRILRAALKADMSKVVILGYAADDEEYFASSVADGGTVLWLMERCKKKLIDID